MALINLHIGKKKLTSEFIENLRLAFIKSEHARIGILKSGTRDKKEAKEWAEKITSSLGKNYTYKIIGWTIVMRKWRNKDMTAKN